MYTDIEISNIEITFVVSCSVLMILFVFRWSVNIVAETQQFVIFTTEQVTLFQLSRFWFKSANMEMHIKSAIYQKLI